MEAFLGTAVTLPGTVSTEENSFQTDRADSLSYLWDKLVEKIYRPCQKYEYVSLNLWLLYGRRLW
jgi:hypothetical protein